MKEMLMSSSNFFDWFELDLFYNRLKPQRMELFRAYRSFWQIIKGYRVILAVKLLLGKFK